MQSIFNPLSFYKIDSKIDRGGDREWYLGTIPSNLFIFQVKNENMFISHTLSVFIVSSENISPICVLPSDAWLTKVMVCTVKVIKESLLVIIIFIWSDDTERLQGRDGGEEYSVCVSPLMSW